MRLSLIPSVVRRSADIAAIRKSRFLRIHRDQAIAALESEPKALLKLVSEMSRRLRHADAAIEDIIAEMTARQIRRMPVVNADGAMIGLLSIEKVALAAAPPRPPEPTKAP